MAFSAAVPLVTLSIKHPSNWRLEGEFTTKSIFVLITVADDLFIGF